MDQSEKKSLCTMPSISAATWPERAFWFVVSTEIMTKPLYFIREDIMEQGKK